MGWDVRRPLPILVALFSACDEGDTLRATPGATPSTLVAGASSSAAPCSELDPSALVSRPMMIGFTRDYCLPCQVMAPAVADLRGEHAATLDVVEVNIDREKSDRYALFFVVESVPTQVFVEPSGRVAARHVGMATREEMTKTLQGLGWIP